MDDEGYAELRIENRKIYETKEQVGTKGPSFVGFEKKDLYFFREVRFEFLQSYSINTDFVGFFIQILLFAKH